MTHTFQVEDDLYVCGEAWMRDLHPREIVIFEFDGETIGGEIVGTDHNYDPPRHFIYTGPTTKEE